MRNIRKIILLLVTTVLGICSVAAFAATDELAVKNVRFISDGATVYTLPAAGKAVSAEIVIDNPSEATEVTAVLAAYDARGVMQDIAVTTRKVIEVLPTVTSGTVSVTASTRSIKLVVWDGIATIRPVGCREYLLSAASRDTTIREFKIALAGNTYQGLINHDLKTIDVYVPTGYATDYEASDPLHAAFGIAASTSPVTDTAPEGYPGCTPENFNAGVKTLTPSITAAGAVAGAGEAKDFSHPVSYTVTAANGETDTYQVTVSGFMSQYHSNFSGTKLGTTYPEEEISQVTDGVTGTGFSTDEWGTNIYCTASQYRTGIFTGGDQGSGSWRFTENSVVYQTHTEDGEDADKRIGFAPASPLRVSLAAGDGTDGKADGDRYGIVTFGYGESTTDNGGTAAFYCYQNGMEAVRSVMASFDFQLRNNTGTGYVRLQSPYFQAILAPALQARGSSADGNFVGSTAGKGSGTATGDGSKGGYTTLRSDRVNNPATITEDTWHNLTFINRGLDMKYARTGKLAVMTEFYLDGEYVGYVYANDFDAYTTDSSSSFYGYLKTGRAAISGTDNLLGFSHSSRTYLDLCLDNVVFGTPV